RGAGRPRAPGEPQGDGERGEDHQGDQTEAGPAQPLVVDERRRPRDEQAEPGPRRMHREREEAPEPRERRRQDDQGPAEGASPLTRPEPFETQTAEERRADRDRQPELDRISMRTSVDDQPSGHRIDPPQREEDAEGYPAPDPGRRP